MGKLYICTLNYCQNERINFDPCPGILEMVPRTRGSFDSKNTLKVQMRIRAS